MHLRTSGSNSYFSGCTCSTFTNEVSTGERVFPTTLGRCSDTAQTVGGARVRTARLPRSSPAPLPALRPSLTPGQVL